MSAIGPEPADPSGAAGTGPTGSEPGQDARDASRPPRRGRQAVVALVVAVVIFALGAPLGLLWHRLAPTVPIIKTADGAVYAAPSPEQFIAADGWFTLLGVGFGILASVASWSLLRRYRGPVGLLAVAAGTVGAGWLAWQVGREIGRDAFRRQAESAAAGTLLHRPPDLRAGGFEWLWNVLPTLHGDLLMPAFGAVVAYTLLAGWSRYPSLRPEGEPRPEPARATDRQSPEPVSWGWQAPQAPAAAPGPPGSDAAEPPRG
jgi:hypothetical protein